MLEFIAAVVGWFASLRSTEAGVDLPSTWTCKASRALWLAFAARPRVRLVLTAVRPEALAAMRPSAAARSLAKAYWVRSGAAGRAATWPCSAAMAAALVPMSAVFWVVVSRGVY